MLIVGHRGARGLVTENTLESFQKALNLGVDAIEFDIWTTKDGVPIVHHDRNLLRMTGHSIEIPDVKYAEIKDILTTDGKKIPTLIETIDFMNGRPIVLEIKDPFLTKEVIEVLKNKKPNIKALISFNHALLVDAQKEFPDLAIYPLSRHPFKLIKLAHQQGYQGIGINSWFFNPLVYWWARLCKLDVYIYAAPLSKWVPANNAIYLKFMKILRLNIGVGTDYPDVVVKILR
jgi:glycerophosphoryl diester phosphodiesterase